MDCNIQAKIESNAKSGQYNSLLIPKERLSVWKKLKGAWRGKINLTSESKKIRKEWERKITG
jgi:hypothetical protein